MKKTIVLTAVGKDRPGIVAAVSKILYETGCNIEDSSMTLLRNDFAMILLVRLPASLNIVSMEKKLNKLKTSLGLIISLRILTKQELTTPRASSGKTYIISVYGTDKPGIVYQVTNLLATNKINITDVQTKVIGSKQKPVYVMILEATIPTKIDMQKLTSELKKVSQKVAVDITIKPVETYQL